MAASKDAPGAQQVGLKRFLELVRADGEAPAPPLRIEVVNADKIGTSDRILKVKRDDAGRLSGASVITPTT